jgi:hypothetical protein
MTKKIKICTTEGTAASCVLVKDGLDDLTYLTDGQKKTFSTAFGTFIRNASANGKTIDVSQYGGRVTTANFINTKQAKSDLTFLHVTVQFVGYNVVNRMKSLENWKSVTFYATLTGGRTSPHRQKMPGDIGAEITCGWDINRDPQDHCDVFINMDWGDHRTNPSGLARSIIHEFLHHNKEMGMITGENEKHRMLDQRARVLLREWGLADGGCRAVNESWLWGPSYPGCDPK